jgi:UDP-2,3-diacylglucosamine pyrophosphatase LpxH
MKVLILSDLHIGSRASRFLNMLEDLRRIARDYDRIVFNGDTLDCYECRARRNAMQPVLRTLTEACTARLGPPIFLSGNHDPAIQGEPWMYLAESRTLIFHGDCISDYTHPTRAEDRELAARLGRHWQGFGGRPGRFELLAGEHRRLQAQFAVEHPPAREPKSTLEYLLSVVTPPQKPFHILAYWVRAPKHAAQLGASFSQPVRHVVFGHTHFAGRWRRLGLDVMNTGSYMPLSLPCAAISDGAQVRFQRVRSLLRTHRSIIAPIPLRQTTLSSNAASTSQTAHGKAH